jgi:hypothetical protein
VVAVDVSKSMLVDDVGPTRETTARHLETSRLARARELARAVIDELPGDRIAPVVFAAAAAHFPLTEDHLVASNFIRDLGPTDLPPGSNLAEVFRVSRGLLRPDLYDDLGCSRIGRRGHGDSAARRGLDPRPREQTSRRGRLQKVERGGDRGLHDGGDRSRRRGSRSPTSSASRCCGHLAPSGGGPRLDGDRAARPQRPDGNRPWSGATTPG